VRFIGLGSGLVGFLLKYILQFVLIILPALTLHEMAHAYAAYLLGDMTAKDAGRLTLNPLRHIDPVGTVLLPMIMLAMAGFSFGWAKAVPVNPSNFKNERVGFFLTSAAGPATNMVFAVVAAFAVRLFGPVALPLSIRDWLLLFARVNLVLMFFNLLPIPPLDGSRVIPLFLPDKALRRYHQVEQYGFGILMVLLVGIPFLFDIDPVGAYLKATVAPLLYALAGMRP